MRVEFQVYADTADEVEKKAKEVLDDFFGGSFYETDSINVSPTMMNGGTGKPMSWQAYVTAESASEMRPTIGGGRAVK